MILAEGFEEVEALTAADLLRRAGICCELLSLSGAPWVTGSHRIRVFADGSFSEADFSFYDGLILPGGMPGTLHLAENDRLLALLRRFAGEGKLTAAICAAPTVLGKAGLLEGKEAVCYPGREPELRGARIGSGPVSADGSVITSRGLGTAIPFALALVRYFLGEEASDTLASAIVYR